MTRFNQQPDATTQIAEIVQRWETQMIAMHYGHRPTDVAVDLHGTMNREGFGWFPSILTVTESYAVLKHTPLPDFGGPEWDERPALNQWERDLLNGATVTSGPTSDHEPGPARESKTEDRKPGNSVSHARPTPADPAIHMLHPGPGTTMSVCNVVNLDDKPELIADTLAHVTCKRCTNTRIFRYAVHFGEPRLSRLFRDPKIKDPQAAVLARFREDGSIIEDTSPAALGLADYGWGNGPTSDRSWKRPALSLEKDPVEPLPKGSESEFRGDASEPDLLSGDSAPKE